MHNVDLSLVPGTGHNGRITRKDVQTYIDSAQTAAEPEPKRSADDERVPLTAIRRMIAENMKRSVSEIPEAWSSMEVDMTNVMAARERAKDDFERREGARLTPLAFALKAVAESLRANPIVNSTWADDAIVLKGQVNLGVAIATDRGLLVPVIADADRLSVSRNSPKPSTHWRPRQGQTGWKSQTCREERSPSTTPARSGRSWARASSTTRRLPS